MFNRTGHQDWTEHDIGAFFKWTERPDWTYFDLPQSLRRAELLLWTESRRIFRSPPKDWASFNVDEFFSLTELSAVAGGVPPSPSYKCTDPDHVPVAGQVHKKRPNRKAQKKLVVPDSAFSDVTHTLSRQTLRCALKPRSSQYSTLVLTKGGARLNDGNIKFRNGVVLRNNAGNPARSGHSTRTSCLPPSAKAKPKASTRSTHSPAAPKPVSKCKPGRRGGRGAAVAKRSDRQAQQKEEETMLDEYAARRHEILADAVTLRYSGAWHIPEAPPEAWARTYAPHVAAAFPAPPRAADTAYQKRYGRVRCFITRQQYPTQPVTVFGHDMRIADELRKACREDRMARQVAMDKRREQNKASNTIDHLLIPFKPKLEDVFPALEDDVSCDQDQLRHKGLQVAVFKPTQGSFAPSSDADFSLHAAQASRAPLADIQAPTGQQMYPQPSTSRATEATNAFSVVPNCFDTLAGLFPHFDRLTLSDAADVF
ncbi:hypothetical protein PsYK624_076190 [Phanerochaete sordida]|uniref:Uncharacterized protein n=1 Tax=Phanerochaete sordida TaxID=48140 RepID=A0A9P3GBS7_9APHY|nr:hypothetical protein PsYK624_076190 [Phanerochaete sordida]